MTRWLALLLCGCAPSYPTCRSACIAPGAALTAGHCVSRREPITRVVDSDCDTTPNTRRADPGETVTVGHRRMRVVDTWLGYVILDGACIPGESGSGVYGGDGALLAVALENHSGLCYAGVL